MCSFSFKTSSQKTTVSNYSLEGRSYSGGVVGPEPKQALAQESASMFVGLQTWRGRGSDHQRLWPARVLSLTTAFLTVWSSVSIPDPSLSFAKRSKSSQWQRQNV